MSEVDTSQETTPGENESNETVDNSQTVADMVNGNEETVEWYLSEGVKGEGDVPEFFKADKFKTLADQAKAYGPLESKIGEKLGVFVGAPEEYELNLPESFKERGLEVSDDDPLLGWAKEFAKNSNMSQVGFDDMTEGFLIYKAAEQKALDEWKAEEFKALGDNGQGRIDNLTAWANKNLAPDLQQGFADMAQSSDSVKAMESLIAMTRSAPMQPENTEVGAEDLGARLKEMQFAKDENGNRRIRTDPAYRAQYEELKKHPGLSGEHRITIGK